MKNAGLKSILEPVWLAEEQAVAIYQMQVWVTRGPRLRLLKEILAEEEHHLGWLEEWMLPPSFRWAHRLMGWALGLAVAFLPDSLHGRIHRWAERQAAEVYARALRRLKELAPLGFSGLRGRLSDAVKQELSHAEAFSCGAFPSIRTPI